MVASVKRTALVTGANRGIGFEVCRQLAQAGLRVVLSGRSWELVREAAGELAEAGLDVRAEQLDIASSASLVGCMARLARESVFVDVLVNNAGIYPTTDVLAVDEETAWAAIEVNVFGAWRTCQAFVPGMVDRGYGRVVNVSSGSGAMCERAPVSGAYGISKAALNALTREVAVAVPEWVKVNAVCPGWVATRMGGTEAPRLPAEAADTIVWLATLPENGPTNGFFRDRLPISW